MQSAHWNNISLFQRHAAQTDRRDFKVNREPGEPRERFFLSLPIGSQKDQG
jgi:hypothetical protein